MKILFYEPQCKGIEHLKFISSTIRCVQNIFPESECELFCEDELCKNLQKDFYFSGTATFSLPAYTSNRVKKVIRFLNFEKKNIKKIKKCGADKIICLSASMYTVHYFSKYMKSERVYMFFHGILENLNHKYRIYNALYWLKPVMRRTSPNITNIVLGEDIKNNFIKIIPNLASSTFFVDHVYPMKNINMTKSFGNKIKFAGIGFGNKAKGSEFIFDLGERFHDSAEFLHIGSMDCSLIPVRTSVNVLGKDSPIEPEAFESAIDRIDFGLFFYDSSKYKLTASGAVFDALTHGKPVICLKNAYFEYVFDKLGDVGYLCESKDEMISVIQGIIDRHDIHKYLEQQRTIASGIWRFSEKEIEKQLKLILE